MVTEVLKRRCRWQYSTMEVVIPTGLLFFLVVASGGGAFLQPPSRPFPGRDMAFFTVTTGSAAGAAIRREISPATTPRQGFAGTSYLRRSVHKKLSTAPADGIDDRGGERDSRRGSSSENTRGEDSAHQEMWASGVWEGEQNEAPSSVASSSDAMVGSPEFVSLVKAQFELLSSAVQDVDRIILCVRKENTEAATLEFVPAIVYPERSSHLWSMDTDGVQVQDRADRRGDHSLQISAAAEAAAAAAAAAAEEVVVNAKNWDTPGAVEGGDGSLSAPVVYASLMLGMVTVFKSAEDRLSEGGGDDCGDRDGAAAPFHNGGNIAAAERESFAASAVWEERDKRLLETVAASVAMGAVLDQKRRWAAVMQVEPLRRVVSESLHQVKNPMTALRTFGKLLLKRLPRDDTLNRELARDIILQSDRLVDVLLPVDAVLGLLATAVEREREAQMPGMMDPQLAQREGLDAAVAGAAAGAASSPAMPSSASNVSPGGVVLGVDGENMGISGSFPQGVQDALLSQSAAPVGLEESLAWEDAAPVGLLSVVDVIHRVARAAQAAAKERRVGFRWRVDDGLPTVIGDERALEEALSNVVENSLKFCRMGRGKGVDGGGGGGGDWSRPTVVLRARFSEETEWGADSGVVIEVVDNGPGIEAEDLPYVFDRGYRGRRPLQCGIPGSGLGLGIARDAIRSFGGELEVGNHNEESGGWGAAVKLYLPRGGEDPGRRRQGKGR